MLAAMRLPSDSDAREPAAAASSSSSSAVVVTVAKGKLGINIEFDRATGLAAVVDLTEACAPVISAGIPIGAKITHVAGETVKGLELDALTAKLGAKRPVNITFSWSSSPSSASAPSAAHPGASSLRINTLKRNAATMVAAAAATNVSSSSSSSSSSSAAAAAASAPSELQKRRPRKKRRPTLHRKGPRGSPRWTSAHDLHRKTVAARLRAYFRHNDGSDIVTALALQSKDPDIRLFASFGKEDVQAASSSSSSFSAAPPAPKFFTTEGHKLQGKLVPLLEPCTKMPPSDAEIEWLMNTRTGIAYTMKMLNDAESAEPVFAKLREFWAESRMRRVSLVTGIRRRMIEVERETLNERWRSFEVEVPITPGSFLPPDLGMVLQDTTVTRSASAMPDRPDGLQVVGFVLDMMGMPGPVEAAARYQRHPMKRIEVGDVITLFRPGPYVTGAKAVRNALNMFVNISVLRLLAPSPRTVALAQNSMIPPAAPALQLKIYRLEKASSHLLAGARERALLPARTAYALGSPLIDQYARATHPEKGADDTLWLFNKFSVISTILVPLERMEEMRALFAQKKIKLDGPEGALSPTWTAHLPKMYDMYTVSELLHKFISFGEVGRGRNKTSLKTTKQVVFVVAQYLKKNGLVAT